VEELHHQRVDEPAEGNLYGNFRGLANPVSDGRVSCCYCSIGISGDFARCSWHRGNGLFGIRDLETLAILLSLQAATGFTRHFVF